jgi:hypothetical protein
MNTLREIAAAAETLPREEQRELLQHLLTTLASNEEFAGQSMHDLMQEGCGIVDSGVPDLASNKEHLMGYGQ